MKSQKIISQIETATFDWASSLPIRRGHSWSFGKYHVFRTLLGTRPRAPCRGVHSPHMKKSSKVSGSIPLIVAQRAPKDLQSVTRTTPISRGRRSRFTSGSKQRMQLKRGKSAHCRAHCHPLPRTLPHTAARTARTLPCTLPHTARTAALPRPQSNRTALHPESTALSTGSQRHNKLLRPPCQGRHR
jgi:hypothetical protein